MVIIVDVEEKHIKNGNPKWPRSCPVALALNELEYGSASVTQNTIRLGDPLEGPCYRAPQSVQDFVKFFDAGASVKPFSFELDLDKTIPNPY
jgi:hypothetical protein